MTVSSDAILTRMMALHPKIIDLTLDRVWRLLDLLGNPQNDLPPVIHIAGTNGKGSTQAMIRAGLEAGGATVHAYTSPHLTRFHERICLAGELISEPALAELLAEVEAVNGTVPITYFEITTCAALLAFARTPADYTLLEVGLGGRLDATNVVERPALTVITPVDLDHQQFLGDTLPEIAGEKAGILKRGVPCVVARQKDEAETAIEDTARTVRAPLIVEGQHWHVGTEAGRVVYQDETRLLDLPLPALAGPHQVQNAGTALAALSTLYGLDDQGRPVLSDAHAEATLTQAKWPARMQRLRRGPLVDAASNAELWLDGGHNPAGARALAATLDGLPKRETVLIAGLLKTKDAAGYFAALKNQIARVITVSIPGEAATFTAEETAKAAQDAGLEAVPAQSLMSAVLEAGKNRILIGGSLYLAGRVLQENS